MTHKTGPEAEAKAYAGATALLLALAGRCEQASVPDRGLDGEIGKAVGSEPFAICDTGNSPIFMSFTASLDAAMSLVPEGCEWRVNWSELPDRTWAGIAGVQGLNTSAATPALALCAAALRARAKQ